MIGLPRKSKRMAAETLDAQILSAHARGDKEQLIALYREAANQCSDVDEACFLLTHAYVYALEMGSPEADGLAERLRSHGMI